MAIDVLEKYYNAKVGYALIQKALSEMISFDDIYVWVLEGNTRAIRFYERVGFVKEDITKILNIDGVKLNEVRMRMPRHN